MLRGVSLAVFVNFSVALSILNLNQAKICPPPPSGGINSACHLGGGGGKKGEQGKRENGIKRIKYKDKGEIEVKILK
jgi:hypothetical protein